MNSLCDSFKGVFKRFFIPEGFRIFFFFKNHLSIDNLLLKKYSVLPGYGFLLYPGHIRREKRTSEEE